VTVVAADRARAGGLGLVRFGVWSSTETDRPGVAVDGGYSRTAWLPVLGATTWLVWGATAARLSEADETGVVTCSLEELAPAWVGSADVVAWSFDRLDAFGLAHVAVTPDGRPTTDDVWRVRRTCPPLVSRQLARAPSTVRAAHVATFPRRRR
jgi:hypothetical protein